MRAGASMVVPFAVEKARRELDFGASELTVRVRSQPIRDIQRVQAVVTT